MKLLFCTLFLTIISTITATPLVPGVQRSFKLKSHVLTPPNPSFETLYLEPYHIYPAFNYAVFALKTAANPGIVGHLNGTADDFTYDNADLIFGFGGSFPYGFVIDQINTTYNPIEINAGGGTKGIFIDQGVIKYHNPISGGFYGQSIYTIWCKTWTTKANPTIFSLQQHASLRASGTGVLQA